MKLESQIRKSVPKRAEGGQVATKKEGGPIDPLEKNSWEKRSVDPRYKKSNQSRGREVGAIPPATSTGEKRQRT